MKEFYMRLYHFFLAPRGHISNSLICCAMYTLCCLEASVAPMKPFFKPDTLSANWKIIPFGNVWSFWLQNKVHSRTSTAAHNMYFTRHREKLDRVVQVEFSILRRICDEAKGACPLPENINFAMSWLLRLATKQHPTRKERSEIPS